MGRRARDALGLARAARSSHHGGMGTWQSGDVEANGIHLHYERTGGDGPPLVLAHGYSDDGLCWTPVARELEAAFDIVMVDARGHGRSDAPRTGYDTSELAADLAGAIRALGLSRPLILGHSMGAVTALAVAGTYPELPRAILLEDPPGAWVERPVPPPPPPPETAPRSATREELIAAQRTAAPGWSEAELGPWADAKLRMSPNARARTSAGTPWLPAAAWPPLMRRIACPVLVIAADPALGALLDDEAAADLRANIADVEIVRISGAGHSVRREQFARYLEVVRGFLAGLDPAT
jgi:N-formylmaleamate deformylase